MSYERGWAVLTVSIIIVCTILKSLTETHPSNERGRAELKIWLLRLSQKNFRANFWIGQFLTSKLLGNFLVGNMFHILRTCSTLPYIWTYITAIAHKNKPIHKTTRLNFESFLSSLGQEKICTQNSFRLDQTDFILYIWWSDIKKDRVISYHFS